MAIAGNDEFGVLPCAHSRKHLTYRPDVNGNPRYQNQCPDCGIGVGNFIAIAVARQSGPLNSLPKFDDSLEEIVYARQREVKDAERAQWWAWYNEYLKSDAWRAKACLVHKRAKGTCEGCLSRPSTQVHHLSYEHAGDELLWELVAVCDECHERAHEDHAK